MKNKNLLLIIALFFSTLMMFGQAPQRIDFQAMARDGSGNPLIAQNISVRISVMAGSTTLYSEVHSLTTDDYGLFTLNVGEGTPISGDFTTIDWSTGNQKVKVEIDPNGGNSYVYMGTTFLASVPYAFYGEDADADPTNEFQTLSISGNDLSISDGNTVTLPGGSSLWSQNGDDIYYNDGSVGIGTNSPEAFLHVPHVNTSTTTAAFGANVDSWYLDPVVSIGMDAAAGDAAAVLYVGEDADHKGYAIWNNDSGDPDQGVFQIGTYGGNNPLVLQFVGNTGVGVTPLVKFHVAESGSDGVPGTDLGLSTQNMAPAVFGSSTNNTNNASSSVGVAGLASSDNSQWSMGIYGEASSGGTYNYGVYGISSGSGTSNVGVFGATSGGATNNYAGYFYGDVHITGNLSKGGGTFKIDHPQDPANKYLIHSFVESPDMMNVYNGNVVTDAEGLAVVELPSYFEAENINFKYQLTVIGQFAQAIIKEEVSNNQFTIQTDKPNVKVSWQVTGVRNDAWANAHRVVPEVEKKGAEKGHYLHPELFGKSKEMGMPIMQLTQQQNSTHKTAPKQLSEPTGPMGMRK